MTADNLAALMNESDEDIGFNKLREESRQAEPPEPDPPSPASSPKTDAQTPPSPKTEAEELVEAKRVVPEAVFLEEKAERKRLERLWQEAAERQARLEERYKVIEERMRPQAPPPPDKAQDPVGYLEHEIAQAKQAVPQVQQLQQRLEAWETQQRIAATVSQSEQEYAARTPDYYDAVEHIRQARVQQYKLAGLNEQQQLQTLMADTRNWTMALLQSGKNPAEATYELARAYGYAAKPAGGTVPSNGVDPAPLPRNADGTFAPARNPKVEQAKQTLKTVERGQQAAKSLGDAPGGTASTDLPSAEELASMSDDDFDKYTSGKNWKKYWN